MKMRTQDGHAHAITKYRLLINEDYKLLFKSVWECKRKKYKSLTVHLPFEIQHKEVLDVTKAHGYIMLGELLKRFFRIKLYWENAPWLNVGKWNLKYSNTSWDNIPDDIDLCLDTGHLMLGCKNKTEFKRKLRNILRKYERQIKFLHLHENNFKTDKHTPVPGKIIDEKMFNILTKHVDYIIEKGE